MPDATDEQIIAKFAELLDQLVQALAPSSGSSAAAIGPRPPVSRRRMVRRRRT
jgi:hypothetical protein